VCHGAVDPFISAAEIAAFKKGMDDGKFDYQFISYAGAVHAFSNPGADQIARPRACPSPTTRRPTSARGPTCGPSSTRFSP
jgi:dienelactone hydrolase